MYDFDRTIPGWMESPDARNYFPIINDSNLSQPVNKNLWLCLDEIYVRRAYVYDPNLWKKYNGIITWNSKLYEKYKNEFKIILLKNYPYIRKYWFKEEEYCKYENKINGANLIQRFAGAGYQLSKDLGCDPVVLRTKLAVDLHKIGFRVDCYGDAHTGIGGVPYNGSQYRTPCPDKIDITNKYKFAITFENCYHEFWSWDYITEKILDAFLSKTVPIYLGSYNIEKRIPKELYIDYRDFMSKPTEELKYCLENLDESQYKRMTDKGLQFYKDHPHYGYIDEFKSTLTRGRSKNLWRMVSD